jgi:hypothetical protein
VDIKCIVKYVLVMLAPVNHALSAINQSLAANESTLDISKTLISIKVDKYFEDI